MAEQGNVCSQAGCVCLEKTSEEQAGLGWVRRAVSRVRRCELVVRHLLCPLIQGLLPFFHHEMSTAWVAWLCLLSQTPSLPPRHSHILLGVQEPHRPVIACWPLLRAGCCGDTEVRRPGLTLKMSLKEEELILAPLHPVTVKASSTLQLACQEGGQHRRAPCLCAARA